MDDKEDKRQIAKLKHDLRETAKRQQPPEAADPAQRGRALGLAMRVISDLVSAIIIGTAIGWGLDYLTGFSPLFLLIFFFLGLAAGIINVLRTAMEMNRYEGNDER